MATISNPFVMEVPRKLTDEELVNAVVAQTLVAVERNELAESEPDGAGVPAAISAPSNDKSAAEPIRPAALS